MGTSTRSNSSRSSSIRNSSLTKGFPAMQKTFSLNCVTKLQWTGIRQARLCNTRGLRGYLTLAQSRGLSMTWHRLSGSRGLLDRQSTFLFLLLLSRRMPRELIRINLRLTNENASKLNQRSILHWVIGLTLSLILVLFITKSPLFNFKMRQLQVVMGILIVEINLSLELCPLKGPQWSLKRSQGSLKCKIIVPHQILSNLSVSRKLKLLRGS